MPEALYESMPLVSFTERWLSSAVKFRFLIDPKSPKPCTIVSLDSKLNCDGNTTVTIELVLSGTGFTNSNLKLVNSCTVVSTADVAAVLLLIVAAVVGLNVVVPLSYVPNPSDVCVCTVIDTGENDNGSLREFIRMLNYAPAAKPVGKPPVIVILSVAASKEQATAELTFYKYQRKESYSNSCASKGCRTRNH